MRRLGGLVLGSILWAAPALADHDVGTTSSAAAASPAVAAGPPAATPVYAPSTQPTLQFERETTTLRPLWLTGLILLSISYPLTVAITSGIEEGTNDPRAGTVIGESAIPVFGPWAILADGGNSPSSAQSSALVFSGILQGVSLTSLIVGLSVHVTRYRPRYQVIGDMSLVPWAPSQGRGLSLVGTF